MSLTDQLVQYLVTGVSVGVVYGLVGLGITIIFNATGVINFAQGEFVMLGGMCAVAFVGLGMPLIMALVLSVVVVTIVGLLVERLTIRTLPGASVVTLIIATIGASLVLKVRYGDTSLLLMGDAERIVELRLLAYGDFLQSDWLKAGHHGAGTSSTPAFLKACRPAGAVVSVGEGNPFRHPSAEVMTRLQETARVVHRTDRDGALVLRSDGRRWRVVDWR